MNTYGLLLERVMPGLFGDPRQPSMSVTPGPAPGVRISPWLQPQAPAGIPQATQPDRSFGSVLGQVFGGQDNPSLSREQNADARRQALIQAGLQTLVASNSEGAPRGLGAVAYGALAGQQAGQQARQGMRAQASADRVRELAAGGDLDAIYQLAVDAAARGDLDTARMAATLYQSRAALDSARAPSQARPDRVTLNEGDGKRGIYYVYPDGRRERIGDADPLVVASPSWQLIPNNDGGPLMERNPRTGEVRPVVGPGGEPMVSAPSRVTEDARKAEGFVPFVTRARGIVDSFEGTPTRLQSIIQARGLNELAPADLQMLNHARIQLNEAWLRMTTGAGYNQEELRNASDLFVPMPGDTPQLLAEKRVARENLYQMLLSRSGGAGGQAQAPSRDVERVDSSVGSLAPDVQPALQRMVEAARADGVTLAVGETRRSQARQDHLHEQGPDVTRTRNSYHIPGRAVDFKNIQAGSPARRWLEQNARRFGFRTIGDWDPGHVEAPSLLESLGGLGQPQQPRPDPHPVYRGGLLRGL